MKTFVLAAAAMLVLGGVAQAAPSTPRQQGMQVAEATTQAPVSCSRQYAAQSAAPNPTGLPSYEMRSDGLMLNGLLPANGWEG
jgi:hypothetical protein